MVVYKRSVEQGILTNLASHFPEYKSQLQSIIDRLWDQLLIFQNHYQDPAFKGSKTLKRVLPVLAPELSYQNLEVKDGGEAQTVWNLMINSSSPSEKKTLHKQLKDYCQMDTLAMVKIHEALREL